jgi:hypothetical protein
LFHPLQNCVQIRSLDRLNEKSINTGTESLFLNIMTIEPCQSSDDCGRQRLSCRLTQSGSVFFLEAADLPGRFEAIHDRH